MASSSLRRSAIEKSSLPPSSSSRRTLPIKRADAEPLSREDIQYDFLDAIFSDHHAVFTDQSRPEAFNRSPRKVTFSLREKMVETPEFAIDFAKISLLANVGRINTTMAFFPEMRTVLRSYHPIPSLQKTEANLQDAPRIKNCLKACLLPGDAPPTTPAEISANSKMGIIPTTSIVNLIFVLSNHSIPVSRLHFDPPFEFLDLFLPVNASSASRARAFLWIIFHYLESPSQLNPFSDGNTTRDPGKVPKLAILTPRQRLLENIDTQEELAYGRRMAQYRSKFLQKQIAEEERDKAGIKIRDDYTSGKLRVTPPMTPRPSNRQRAYDETVDMHPSLGKKNDVSPNSSNGSYNGHAGHSTVQENRFWTGSPFRKERTMLEHAWHTAVTTDPLTHSDEEIGDEHVRVDYERRLHVLNTQVRRKAMTPEPERSAISNAYLARERRSLLQKRDWDLRMKF